MPRQRRENPNLNSRRLVTQHVLLWVGLGVLTLALIALAITIFTGGRAPFGQAATVELTYFEDFTTTTYKDPTTTLNWNTAGEQTPGEAALFHGAWTHINDRALIGYETFDNFTGGVNDDADVNVFMGPDNQPHVIYTTITDNPPVGVEGLEDDFGMFYAHWDPDFNGPGQGEWLGADNTVGATRASDLPGDPDYNGIANAARGRLAFDDNNLPVVSWWGRVPGASVEVFVSRWCANPGTIAGATVFGAFGDLDCTSTGPVQVSSEPGSQCQGDMAVDSRGNPHFVYFFCGTTPPANLGVYYTRWDDQNHQFQKADGSPGRDELNIIATAGNNQNQGIRLAVGNDDQPYIAYKEGGSPLGTPQDIVARTADVYGGGTWQALNGVGSKTILTTAPSNQIPHITILRNPVTDNVVFSWYQFIGGNATLYTAWDGAQLVDLDGNPGITITNPTFFSSINTLGGIATIAYNPAHPQGYPIVLVNGAYFEWNGVAYVAHPNKTIPETLPAAPNAWFKMAVNNEGQVFAVTTNTTATDNELLVTTYTNERVDNTKNLLVSKVVDGTDKPIVAATIEWTGGSDGYAGTFSSQPRQPFTNDGRNQFVDLDCSLSNNAGVDFYPAAFRDRFIFPTIGSNLIYKCSLDSGTLLDNPVIEDLSIVYEYVEEEALLSLLKGVEIDGDNDFNDSGQQVLPGDILTYRLLLTNGGTTDAQDVVVKDALPAGTQYIPNSTQVNGVTVPDVAGQSPLAGGLDIGSVPSGTFLQYTWEGGPGQDQFTNVTKFKEQNATEYRNVEYLSTPTGQVYSDLNFKSGQNLRLDAGAGFFSSGPALKGGLIHSNGNLFAVWEDLGDIYGRLFDPAGNPLTGQIAISAASPINYERPSVVELSNGDMVVIYQRSFSSAASAVAPQNIVMVKMDANANIYAPGEIILASEPVPAFAPYNAFVSMDTATMSLFNGGKNAVIVDANDDIYLGLVRSPSGGASYCGKAIIAKYDSAGTPQFEKQIDGGSCNVRQAPSIAMSSSGNIMGVYGLSISLSFTSFMDFEAATIDANGVAVLAGPTNVFSTGGPSSAIMASLVPVSGDEFLMNFRGDGPCPGQCIQKIKHVLPATIAVTAGPTQIVPAGFNIIGDLVVDEADNRIIHNFSGLFGSTGINMQALDLSFNKLGDPVNVSVQSNPRSSTSFIDVVNNKIWVTWQVPINGFYGQMALYEPQPSHTLLSSIYDAKNPTNWQALKTTQVLPAGDSIVYQIRAGNTALPDASWTPFITSTPDTVLDSTLMNKQYLQYKIDFTNVGNLSEVPEVHDISIGQSGPIAITYQVMVTTNNTQIKNSASATASNVPGTTTTPPATNTSGNPQAEEIEGEDRIDTAIELSKNTFGDGEADCVVISRSDDPIEALSGAPLAAACHGPILLTPPSSLDPRTLAEIKRILPTSGVVYPLGQEQALGNIVLGTLQDNGYGDVRRRGGRNREVTSVEIALELETYEGNNFTQAFFANGFTFADAVSGAPVAARKLPGQTRSPMLLARSTGVAQEVIDYLESRSAIANYFVLGGSQVMPAAITDRLTEISHNPALEVVAGENRFATTVAVALRFFGDPTSVFVSSGFGLPVYDGAGNIQASVPVDALVSGPAAAALNVPVLFSPQDLPIPTPIEDYLVSHKNSIGSITFVGGINAISSDIRGEMLFLISN